MNIHTISCAPLETNCYILWSEGEGVIIDPGMDTAEIIEFIENENITVKYILLTHGHFDHCSGLGALKKAFDVPIALNKDDLLYVADAKQHAMLYGIKVPEIPLPETFIEDGDVFTFGDCALRTIATPGHSPGGVCFLYDNHLFAGDTLFHRSIGRTDLPGGNHQQLLHSIMTKLYTLPPETIVYCGHGETTTIGDEIRCNPFTA